MPNYTKGEIKATTTKELLADYGSEVMALVQRGETDRLAQLTDDAHEELNKLIKEQNHDMYEALKIALPQLEKGNWYQTHEQSTKGEHNKKEVINKIKQALAKGGK